MDLEEELSSRKDQLASRWYWLFLILLAVAGFALIAFHTRFGPGTGGDSTSYVMGADNLLAGHGFSRFSGGYEIRPISGFPPIYSMALAAIHGAGLPLIPAARWLNAALFAANIFLVGFLVGKRVQNLLPGLIAASLFMAADQIFHWHSWVMSEPLFIFLMLIGIWFLSAYFNKQRRYLAALAGFLFALATLTRYAGVSLFVAGAFVLFLFDRDEWRKRLVDGGLFLLVGAAVIGIWLVRNASEVGSAVNREIIFHGIDVDLLRLYLAEVSAWFVPHEIPLPTIVRAGLAVGIAFLLFGIFFRFAVRSRVIQFRRWKIERVDASLSMLPWFLIVFMTAYSLVLALNSLLLDASTSPSAVPRYLTPVHTALIIFGVAEFARFSIRRVEPTWQRLGLAYFGLLLFLYAGNTVGHIREPLAHLGYTGDRIESPELVEALSQLDLDRPILSNNPELFFILAGRPAYVRPIQFDHYQERYRDDFELQLESAKEKIDQGGVMVIFKPVESIDELVIEQTEVMLIMEFDRAILYGAEGLSID